MVQSSVTRMSGLIENVMDFARSRLGGGFVLNRTSCDPLEPMLRQIIAELQTSSPGRVIEVHLDLTEPVNCDQQRIGELLSNLLGNAITHTPPAEPIRVGATTVDGVLEIFVANAGDSIPAERMQVLFTPFTRGSRKGLGLGLYICKEIAEAHGGAIEAVSAGGETRFTFRMPLQ